MASPPHALFDDGAEPFDAEGRAALDECVLDWLEILAPATFAFLFTGLHPYSNSISGSIRDRIAVYLDDDAESRREVRNSLRRLRAAGHVQLIGRRYSLTRKGERRLRELWGSRPACVGCGPTCAVRPGGDGRGAKPKRHARRSSAHVSQ
jgi:hypothetical protein